MPPRTAQVNSGPSAAERLSAGPPRVHGGTVCIRQVVPKPANSPCQRAADAADLLVLIHTWTCTMRPERACRSLPASGACGRRHVECGIMKCGGLQRCNKTCAVLALNNLCIQLGGLVKAACVRCKRRPCIAVLAAERRAAADVAAAATERTRPNLTAERLTVSAPPPRHTQPRSSSTDARSGPPASRAPSTLRSGARGSPIRPVQVPRS